jgi:hypothetical protein
MKQFKSFCPTHACTIPLVHILLAAADDKGRRFGHHYPRRASPTSIKHRGQHKLINFYTTFIILLNRFEGGVGKIYEEGRPPLQRRGYVNSMPLEG